MPSSRFSRLAAPASCVVAALSLACGGDRPSPTEPEPRVARVDVTPGVDTLTALGQTRQFTAVARDAAGNAISGKSFTWQSSAPEVASAEPTTGLVTAVANGEALIRATVDGVTGQAAITVGQVATALAFITQPASTQVGILLSPPPRVAIQDALGSPVGTWTAPVVVRLAANAAEATALGTTAVAPAAGVAAFSHLRIDRAGVGQALVASSHGLPEAASSVFDVAPSPLDGAWSLNPAIVTTCPGRLGISITLRVSATGTMVEKSEVVFTLHLTSSLGEGDFELPVPFDYATGSFAGSGSMSVQGSWGSADGTLMIEGGFTGTDAFSAHVTLTMTLVVALGGGRCTDVDVTVTGTRVG